jgi:UDP-N-acetylglucosamine 4,6-dehydratase
MKVTDTALALAPDAKQEMIGIRQSEKLHERMTGDKDSYYTYESRLV